MRVEGTASIVVDIDRNEAFKALVGELGISGLLNESSHEYYKVEDGVLRRYYDTSYHGSPNYVLDKKFEITDPVKVRLYLLMKETKDLLRKLDN